MIVSSYIEPVRREENLRGEVERSTFAVDQIRSSKVLQNERRKSERKGRVRKNDRAHLDGSSGEVKRLVLASLRTVERRRSTIG